MAGVSARLRVSVRCGGWLLDTCPAPIRRPISLARRSTASRCMSGRTAEYTSEVTLIDEWPIQEQHPKPASRRSRLDHSGAVVGPRWGRERSSNDASGCPMSASHPPAAGSGYEFTYADHTDVAA